MSKPTGSTLFLGFFCGEKLQQSPTEVMCHQRALHRGQPADHDVRCGAPQQEAPPAEEPVLGGEAVEVSGPPLHGPGPSSCCSPGHGDSAAQVTAFAKGF